VSTAEARDETAQIPTDATSAIHVTKYNGSYHRRIPVERLSHDPPLHCVRFDAGARVTVTPDPDEDPEPFLTTWGAEVLLFEDRWYNVERGARDGRTLYYVNIASPVRFDGHDYHYVDLDLDIWWWTDERPKVLDEDEFLDHSRAMSYPADVIQRARAAVDEALGLIEARAFPFGER
jgi:protein associated with RNAse G/E